MPLSRFASCAFFAAACVIAALLPTRAASAAGPNPEETAAYSRGEQAAALVKYAERAKSDGFSGAFLAAVDGQVVAAAGVGFADSAHTILNTPATLFEIASTTKPFTAIAVMLLQEDGKLQLADPIGKHLPGVPDTCSAILVEHLVRHTSGIPATNSRGAGDDLAAVLPQFLEGGPLHTPGKHWEYWNQGYALLSEIIARASGKSYVDFCRERIFAPAGMSATCFTGDTAPQGYAVATGRSSRAADRSALGHPYGAYGFQYRGMGGIVTTVWDLWRWDRALAAQPPKKPLLSEKSQALLFNPGPGNFGLGWFLARDAQKRPIQSHSGSVRGFVAELRRYPARDGFIVVLCNDDSCNPRKLADGLAALLFGDAKPPALLEPVGVKAAAGIDGRYTCTHGGRVLTLTIEHDGAVARIEWGTDGPVTHARVVADDAGAIFLDDGSRPLAMAIVRKDDGTVSKASIKDMEFARQEKP